MKTIILLGIFSIFLSLQAAPLQTLSENLSSGDGDKTKEKVPNEETRIIEANNKNKTENDANVEALDKLKSSYPTNRDVLEIDEKLEDSLKKLHNTNHYNKAIDEKPIKSYRGAARLAYGQNADEVTEATTLKQKEIYEDLPLPDTVNSAIVRATKNGKSSSRNDGSPNASSMLRQLNGKYSAYDMAQYIFWTDDEKGVAKAVEELIDEGLMTRENAIEFLNDIRLGIDYLENTYSFKNGETKNTIPFARITQKTISSTSEAPIDGIPFNYNYNYQKFHSFFTPGHKNKIHHDDEAPTLSPGVFKALEKIPSLMKLTEGQSFANKHDSMASYDEGSGRSRLADFLYGEYSLEEVIYQLAKTMFTQSLTHGSEESQSALQKLTQFLESEGENGRISQTLQKKILDVLLAALSDTLNENPDVMEKARHALNKK